MSKGIRKNPVEWAVLITSVIVIAGLVGILVATGLNPAGPPNPVVELHSDQARRAEQGWLLPATVTNRGSSDAEDVVVEATTQIGGQSQASRASVRFLPAGTSGEIVFGFSTAPSGSVSVRVVSYAQR